MRNVGGAIAQRKLTRAIIAALSVGGISFQWLSSKSNVWLQGTENDPDIELDVKGLSWSNNGQNRTVRYNLTVPFLKKNVDLCLFNCSYQEISVSYKNPVLYVALGELKGGIDPAGADEHWKTASTSLSRIRDAFTSRGLSPQLFFVGAAIENSMSEEIWNQLENSMLGNAANLTDANQALPYADGYATYNKISLLNDMNQHKNSSPLPSCLSSPPPLIIRRRRRRGSEGQGGAYCF